MARRLLISALPGEQRAAWFDGARLEDLVIQRDDQPSLLGNLYLGRVLKTDKSLDAAFVEIGLARPALLPAGECPGGLPNEGRTKVLRVVREPTGDKGARVTARIQDPPEDLEALAMANPAPALMLRGDDPLTRLLVESKAPGEILVDDPDSFADLKARLAARRPELLPALRLVLEYDLFEQSGLEEAIEGLLGPRVDLPRGGHLLIEPISTLTAIDVNSGGNDTKGGPERLAEAVNYDALPEIVRQLRLRALSGLIVVDFLALPNDAARKALVASLRQALKADPEPTRVLAMSPSGLIEMTRRRGRPPLHELLTEPAGIDGGGRRKDAVTLAYQGLRALAREARARPGGAPGLAAGPAVISALQGPAAAARKNLETRLGAAITLRVQAAWPEDRVEPEMG